MLGNLASNSGSNDNIKTTDCGFSIYGVGGANLAAVDSVASLQLSINVMLHAVV
jgi:hypothetical protein